MTYLNVENLPPPNDPFFRNNHQSRKRFCPRGHPYDEENTYYHKTPSPVQQHRACLICKRAQNRKSWRKMQALGLPTTKEGE